MLRFRWMMAMGLSLGLGGCATLGSTPPQAALDYQPEQFASVDTHSSRFDHPPGVTCEAARRALLSQGYIVTEAKADQVLGRKLFQPEVNRHMEMEFRVVCAGQGADQKVTEAFANGVQAQYGMRKVNSSASLGVGGVGSLSLPVQGENDTLVKIGSQTVSDPQMYRRFFELMRQYIDPHVSLAGTVVSEGNAEPARVPVETKPAPAPAPQPVVVVVPMQHMSTLGEDLKSPPLSTISPDAPVAQP